MAETRYTPRDHFQEVTDRIVAALEAGVPPWRKPWDSDKAMPSGPFNAATGRRYHGVNIMLLGSHPRTWETGDPRWCSFDQAKAKGWRVRKGEKAALVFFFKPVQVADRDAPEDVEKEKTVPVLRAYPIFHAATQIDGVPPYVAPGIEEAPWRAPEATETILHNSGAVIREGGDKAFYAPSQNLIQLPPKSAFLSADAWSATALHELGHWTGHESRLNRNLSGRWGNAAYSQEELRAELCSVFTAAEMGLPLDLGQHTSYIDSWVAALKRDKREIFRAAADASKAAEMCLGFHPDYAARLAAEKSADGVVAEQPRPLARQTASAAPTPAAAYGPMPTHIARRLNPQPAAEATPATPPTIEEAPTWTYAPR